MSSRPHTQHAQTYGPRILDTDTDFKEQDRALRPTQSTPVSMPESLQEPGGVKAPAVTPFAGRLGGNQEFIVDRDDPANAALLQQFPDAAPQIPWKKLVDLRPLKDIELWKAAVVEAVGKQSSSFAIHSIHTSLQEQPSSSS
jgi:hypothetical protein